MRRKKRCGCEGSDWTTAWVFPDCLIVIWFGGDYTFARGSSCSRSMDRVVRFLQLSTFRSLVTRRQGTEMAVGFQRKVRMKIERLYEKHKSRLIQKNECTKKKPAIGIIRRMGWRYGRVNLKDEQTRVVGDGGLANKVATERSTSGPAIEGEDRHFRAGQACGWLLDWLLSGQKQAEKEHGLMDMSGMGEGVGGWGWL